MVKHLDSGILERLENGSAEHVSKAVAEKDRNLGDAGFLQKFADVGGDAALDLKD